MVPIQWVFMYLCVAALVAGAAVVLAAWPSGTERTTPHITVGPALLAGVMWPLLVVGAVQWLLVYGLATTLRAQPERTSEARYYGPPAPTSRRNVEAR